MAGIIETGAAYSVTSPIHMNARKGIWDLDLDCGSSCSNSTSAPCTPDKISAVSSPSLRSQSSPPHGLQELQTLDLAASLISIGSSMHGTGECKPCAWFWKPGSCRNGSNCARCHLCPSGEIKSRKKAKQVFLRSQASKESIGADETGVPEEEPEPKSKTEEQQDALLDEICLSKLSIQSVHEKPRLLPPPGLTLVEVPEFSHTAEPRGLCQSQVKLFATGELKATKIKVASLRISAVSADERADVPEEVTLLKPTSAMPPPPPMPPVLSSVGSLCHGSGFCRPCTQWKTGSCPAGRSCTLCHLCPENDERMMIQAKLAGIRLNARPFATLVACREAQGGSASTTSGTASTVSTPRSKQELLIDRGVGAATSFVRPDTMMPLTPEQVSIGSLLHASGRCSPCAWFWKAQGCTNGIECGRCHFCPPGEVKNRKKAKLIALRHSGTGGLEAQHSGTGTSDAASVLRSLQLL